MAFLQCARLPRSTGSTRSSLLKVWTLLNISIQWLHYRKSASTRCLWYVQICHTFWREQRSIAMRYRNWRRLVMWQRCQDQSAGSWYTPHHMVNQYAPWFSNWCHTPIVTLALFSALFHYSLTGPAHAHTESLHSSLGGLLWGTVTQLTISNCVTHNQADNSPSQISICATLTLCNDSCATPYMNF